MSSKRSIKDVLSPGEIRALTELSDAWGWWALCCSWGIVAGSMALVGLWPRVWTIALALVLIGGRQLGLSILMHDASHRSLFRSRRLNDLVGEWLCAAPTWGKLSQYRTHHLAHHAHTGTKRDTDVGLVRPFPTTTMGLARKFLRDLSGIAGFRRVIGLVLMDAEVLAYTASVDARRLERKPTSRHVANFVRNFAPTFYTNALMLTTLALFGHAELYGLWVIAYLTTFSLFLRIRAIAEHACTGNPRDDFRNTRTTLASPLARLTVAPHRVNFHLEHHLLMTVPHQRLPRLHRLLSERGALEGAHVARSYPEVLRRVTRAP